ncbi:MAG: hypothetical protein QN141_00775 [Armatimonadota bacterium]|nr:hypothetical protein [Armatimonadota bacterium]MDR7450870.1 hypothetical protein [Armatimonadota bacterium]MDR7465792.1 hypothetical protein [Armatimonadota bacterium]MDR7493700.1 hypothetical protein [Armatimonadota bacterium]MDR7499052.1 hypothetical protein [Armatimonadota bacterium]
MTASNADDIARWRAAHAETLRLARALERTAAIFRRCAGELRYHPQTGLSTPLPADLIQAAQAMRETLAAVSAAMARWHEEVTWIRSLDPARTVDEIQQGHAAGWEAARLLKATLEVFDQAVLHPEVAPLDAPYGTGAPKRVHPGAQCTWVAERGDALAREVADVTLRKENLLQALAPRPA